jgi:hypothetical protein
MIQVKSAPASALAGVWDAVVLDPVREINEQVVDMLCEAAAAAGDGSAGLLAVVRGEFLQAPAAARRRLANCPYLLLDAGFGESARWARPPGVRDAPAGAAARPGVDCGVGLARRALVLGWHLARSNRLAARVALGMTPACAELVGGLRLTDLEAFAETDRGCVRLRWESRPELWRPLLRAALAERPATLTGLTLAGLQMRGLQLLAADSGLADS